MSVFRLLNIANLKYPYTSQGVVSSVLHVTGDAIAQKFIEKKKKFDFRRSLNFSLIGFGCGIVTRKWYGILEMKFQNPNRYVNTFGKVAADQLLFNPVYLLVTTGLLGYLKSGTWNGIVDLLKRDYTTILFNDFRVGTAIQFVNFYWIPLNYQVLVNSTVDVIWETYFSYKIYSNKDKDSEAVIEQSD